MLCGALSYLSRRFVDNRVLIKPETMRLHHKLLQKYYEARKDWTVSNLGKCLFKFSSTRPPTCEVINHPELIHPDSNLFHILIWRHEGSTKRRHMDGSGKHGKDPLRGCSVQNCRFTENDDSWIPFVDAVVVHLNKALLPNWQQQSKRKPHQRWIFWTEEPPVYTFSGAEPGTVKPRLKDMANIFNWSMTYRSDSDIPVPYGRTIPLLYPKLNNIYDAEPSELVPFWSRKQTRVLATILMSHCKSFRLNFVMQLQKFLSVDFYGRCSKVPGNAEK
ncbi:alpha-(1,3)-fucosyltransferase C-like [Leguminivora glycinivorella]|uniref:alpha-(1,3)-fucosyltransferase C-like n=1 Tax=Leguminivora glycinivorella TaxID=1035111 RepID=UPI00200D3EF5|nr:alpha-(1,3)-fucosyltransferase C-like [Leguminivora glycinivorella]